MCGHPAPSRAFGVTPDAVRFRPRKTGDPPPVAQRTLRLYIERSQFTAHGFRNGQTVSILPPGVITGPFVIVKHSREAVKLSCQDLNPYLLFQRT